MVSPSLDAKSQNNNNNIIHHFLLSQSAAHATTESYIMKQTNNPLTPARTSPSQHRRLQGRRSLKQLRNCRS